jgi:hypothetical protein
MKRPVPADGASVARVTMASVPSVKIVIYTTAPGREDEGKLDLARVAGARRAR